MLSALLSPRGVTVTTLWFVVLIGIANRFVRLVDHHVIDIDRAPYWPIGIFEPRSPTLSALAAAVGCLALFAFFTYLLERGAYRIPTVIAAGLALIVATNGLHGFAEGYDKPIAGSSDLPRIQYYDDSLRIGSAAAFLRDFNISQPALLDHARTHPPGAVLAIHALRVLLENPARVSLAIAAISVVLGAALFYSLINRLAPEVSGHSRGRLCSTGVVPSGYLVLLFLLTPAVQVYYLASIDALVATCSLGCILLFLNKRTVPSIVGAAFFLCAAGFLTFAAMFLPPVLVAVEWTRRRRVNRSLTVAAIVILVYVALYAIFGFNYFAAFRTAAALENPEGFRLFTQPASYLFTRLECVGEILLFFGPFLTILAWRGRHDLSPIARTMCAAAVFTLLAMLATGAFHAGETARACGFIYPFLLLPAAAALRSSSPQERHALATVVFAQSLLMQLLGDYFW